MANFTYEHYRSPYIGSIMDMMLHANDPAARAAEISGQAHAAAAQGIGQAVGALPGQLAQGQRQGVIDESNRLKLTQEQQAVRDDQLFRMALAKAEASGGDMRSAVEFLKQQGGAGINALQKLTGLAQAQQAEHDEKAGELGYRLAQSGNTIEALQTLLPEYVQNGLLTKIDASHLTEMASTDPSKLPAVSRDLMARSPKFRTLLGVENAAPGSMARNKITGEVIPGSQAPFRPTAPTTASIALEASGGDPQAALESLKPPPQPRAAPSMEEQLLTAISTGDTGKAQQIRETLKQAAMARKDPAAFSLAAELGNLRKEEARARLDAMQQKAAPLDVAPDIQTTQAGRKYIDLSGYQGEERNKARTAANEAGAIPVSKEQADALQNIDNARSNQASILTQISDVLPKGPAGRAGAALAVPLEKLFQTNDQIAAFNTWRTAAIQTMRATAGSKGLRINRAEIEQAVENDIPKLTDTVSVAQQKIKNVETMLENAEQSILVRNRAVTPPTYGPPAPPTLTPGLRRLGQRP